MNFQWEWQTPWAMHPLRPMAFTALKAGWVLFRLWLWLLCPRLSFQCWHRLPRSLLIGHTSFGRSTSSHGVRLHVHTVNYHLATLLSLLSHMPRAQLPSGHPEHLRCNRPQTECLTTHWSPPFSFVSYISKQHNSTCSSKIWLVLVILNPSLYSPT